MRRALCSILLMCSFLVSGCATSMVTVQDEKMENGILMCYTELYVVPQRVADDESSIREHIEKRGIEPREKSVKPC